MKGRAETPVPGVSLPCSLSLALAYFSVLDSASENGACNNSSPPSALPSHLTPRAWGCLREQRTMDALGRLCSVCHVCTVIISRLYLVCPLPFRPEICRQKEWENEFLNSGLLCTRTIRRAKNFTFPLSVFPTINFSQEDFEKSKQTKPNKIQSILIICGFHIWHFASVVWIKGPPEFLAQMSGSLLAEPARLSSVVSSSSWEVAEEQDVWVRVTRSRTG